MSILGCHPEEPCFSGDEGSRQFACKIGCRALGSNCRDPSPAGKLGGLRMTEVRTFMTQESSFSIVAIGRNSRLGVLGSSMKPYFL